MANSYNKKIYYYVNIYANTFYHIINLTWIVLKMRSPDICIICYTCDHDVTTSIQRYDLLLVYIS